MNKNILTGNQQPFLNPVIVEKVLEFCKLNSADIQSYSKLRLVCKLWDDECSKVLRQETQIPLSRLLEPYPYGLGWSENRYELATDSLPQFNCPSPLTRNFENFQFTSTCESSNDIRVIQWFTVMGEQVKSLHSISALSCFHHNDFLANILYKWCPNLETLHLDGIQCFSSLIFIFEGKSNGFQILKDCAINCKKLKNLTISVEDDNKHRNCSYKVGEMLDEVISKDVLILRLMLDHFNHLIDMLPEKNLSFDSEISDLFFQLIESGVPDILSSILGKYTKLSDGVDWGVLGHILKTVLLQKLVISKLDNVIQSEDLTMFLLFQPSKLRSTLQILEFQDVSLPSSCLKTLSLLKCELWRLRLDKLVWSRYAKEQLEDILKNNADTLTNFEVGSKIVIFLSSDHRHNDTLQIPFLPKLKSFTNKTLSMLHVNGFHLLKNAPCLEKCHIFEGSNSSTENATSKALQTFCANLDDICISGHPLKELKWDIPLDSCKVMLLRKWLTNLEKVELKICNASGMILGFSSSDGWKKLQAATLSLGIEKNANWMKFRKIGNKDIAKCFDKLESLQFLKLIYDPKGTEVWPASFFTDGLRRLKGLTSLKIHNLCILSDEKEEIDKSILHLPFVSFAELTVISKGELE